MKTRMMGAEPASPNELSPITRIDTARVRRGQSAAGRSFIEPGSPWQNRFVESFGSRVRDEVLSVEGFDSVLVAQTVVTDWRTIYNHRRPTQQSRLETAAPYAASLTTNKSEKPARLSCGPAVRFAPCGSDLFVRRDVRWSSIAGPGGPMLPGSSSGCHNCCVEPNGNTLLAK